MGDVAEMIAVLVPNPQARVLDYGCGESLHADLVAAVAHGADDPAAAAVGAGADIAEPSPEPPPGRP